MLLKSAVNTNALMQSSAIQVVKKQYLGNNEVSISTVCYLCVYCQTVNIAARGNSHYQLGMAESK